MKIGSSPAPRRDVVVLIVAVALMLGGVVMIFTDVSTGIAFPAIAVGIALVVFVEAARHRRPNMTH